MNVQELKKTANQVRKNIVTEVYYAKAGHPGGSLSAADICTIKPLDEELIVKTAKKTGKVVTAEEHNIIGGLGGAVAKCLAEKCPTKMYRIGMRDRFGESGTAGELLHKYMPDGEGIYKQVKAFVK